MDPIIDRGPSPSFYDPPSEPKSYPCTCCDGNGKFGCTRFCSNSEYERHLCEQYHTCPMKCINGRLEASQADFKNTKADEDYDARREMDRG